MSGTLPIRMEAPLISELCLQPDTIIVCKSSNRPELQYHIESALKSLTDLQKCIQEIVYSQKLSSSERGLVFVTSISDGLLLAKGLQCEFYCADDRIYASSSGGEGKRMLGKESNISKQGIFNLQSDIVKRWREGADEKNKILVPRHSIDDSWDLMGRKAMYDMIWTSTKCLRLCFTRYIDEGRGITCLQDLQNQICSWCQDKVQPDLQTVEIPNQVYIGITDQTLPAQFTAQHLPSISTTHSIAQTHVQLKTKRLQPIRNHSSAHTSTSILSLINANTSPIEIFDNLSSEEHKDPEKSFIEQARLAKKRKVEIEFEKEDYVASLRRALDAIDGKCTVCMLEKRSIISRHDHMANRCTHLDFG